MLPVQLTRHVTETLTTTGTDTSVCTTCEAECAGNDQPVAKKCMNPSSI
jgi:hypothetical protein